MVKRLILFCVFTLLSLLLVQGVLAGMSVVGEETAVSCTNHLANSYPCHNVNLLAHLPLTAIGAEDSTVTGSDHWGWHDSETGRDFVLFGLSNGTAFVEITDRQNPVYLGKLPSHNPGESSIWWDIKVYQDTAYIVGDIPSHNGLQIFDLTQLRDVASPPVTFSETNHYDGFGPGHNLWVNPATASLYVARTDTCPTLTMFDISQPHSPVPNGPNDDGVPGCFIDEPTDKIISDAECVIYNGPDADYTDQEICVIGSDATISIADVTNKAAPVVITNTIVYTGHPVTRLHQGALTPDQRFLLFSDVMDEPTYGHNTRTYVWDLADLDAPRYVGFYEGSSPARDHNLYIIPTASGNVAFETNWRSGLRVLSLNSLPSPAFSEIGYFDIDPASDSPASDGAWNNYPWWGDGVVTVSGSKEGLFVLQFAPPQQFLPFISSQ